MLNQSTGKSNCPCGADKVSVMLSKIDGKLVGYANKHLNYLKYDTDSPFDMDEVSMLMSLKRMFVAKSTLCTECFAGLPLENICSKILRIISK
jgi:hypothetical protein